MKKAANSLQIALIWRPKGGETPCHIWELVRIWTIHGWHVTPPNSEQSRAHTTNPHFSSSMALPDRTHSLMKIMLILFFNPTYTTVQIRIFLIPYPKPTISSIQNQCQCLHTWEFGEDLNQVSWLTIHGDMQVPPQIVSNTLQVYKLLISTHCIP